MALENLLKRSGIGNHLQNVDYFLLMVYWWIHIHVVYGNLGCLLLFIDSTSGTSQSWLASGGIPQLLGRKTLGGHCQDQLQHYLGVSGSMQMWIYGFDQIMVWYLWHQAARGSKFDVSYSTLKDGKVDFFAVAIMESTNWWSVRFKKSRNWVPGQHDKQPVQAFDHVMSCG